MHKVHKDKMVYACTVCTQGYTQHFFWAWPWHVYRRKDAGLVWFIVLLTCPYRRKDAGSVYFVVLLTCVQKKGRWFIIFCSNSYWLPFRMLYYWHICLHTGSRKEDEGGAGWRGQEEAWRGRKEEERGRRWVWWIGFFKPEHLAVECPGSGVLSSRNGVAWRTFGLSKHICPSNV